MSEIYDFAVIGGDLRQLHAARILEQKGYRVCRSLPCDDKMRSCTLEEAVCRSRAVLAPVPLSMDGHSLNQKFSDTPIPLAHLLKLLKHGQNFFAGCIPSEFLSAAAAKHITATDFMQDEELALYNSIATAEGTVAEAIIQSPRNLHGSRCLILGYGKCARTLADLLRGMHCHTTVHARGAIQRAEAAIMAGRAVECSRLEEVLAECDFIFNTIPSLILNRTLLTHTNPDAFIFDLASAPGGVDLTAARELGIFARPLPGLPGRYAPASSAEAIAELVLRHLSLPETSCSLIQPQE